MSKEQALVLEREENRAAIEFGGSGVGGNAGRHSARRRHNRTVSAWADSNGNPQPSNPSGAAAVAVSFAEAASQMCVEAKEKASQMEENAYFSTTDEEEEEEEERERRGGQQGKEQHRRRPSTAPRLSPRGAAGNRARSPRAGAATEFDAHTSSLQQQQQQQGTARPSTSSSAGGASGLAARRAAAVKAASTGVAGVAPLRPQTTTSATASGGSASTSKGRNETTIAATSTTTDGSSTARSSSSRSKSPSRLPTTGRLPAPSSGRSFARASLGGGPGIVHHNQVWGSGSSGQGPSRFEQILALQASHHSPSRKTPRQEKTKEDVHVIYRGTGGGGNAAQSSADEKQQGDDDSVQAHADFLSSSLSLAHRASLQANATAPPTAGHAIASAAAHGGTRRNLPSPYAISVRASQQNPGKMHTISSSAGGNAGGGSSHQSTRPHSAAFVQPRPPSQPSGQQTQQQQTQQLHLLSSPQHVQRSFHSTAAGVASPRAGVHISATAPASSSHEQHHQQSHQRPPSAPRLHTIHAHAITSASILEAAATAAAEAEAEHRQHQDPSPPSHPHQQHQLEHELQHTIERHEEMQPGDEQQQHQQEERAEVAAAMQAEVS